MPVKKIKWITRQIVRDNPDWIFVFGDNASRTGLGGQAKEMRGEPNAIGVATKWKPSMAEDAFFRDEDYKEIYLIVSKDLWKVHDQLAAGKTVVVPEDGIGTGLSRLEIGCPRIFNLITNAFKYWETYDE